VRCLYDFRARLSHAAGFDSRRGVYRTLRPSSPEDTRRGTGHNDRGITDTLEEWLVEGAADGYNILPAYFPAAFADFVDLVVPELQHRGLLRRDYEGQTLRDHLGLPRAAAPARLREAAGAE